MKKWTLLQYPVTDVWHMLVVEVSAASGRQLESRRDITLGNLTNEKAVDKDYAVNFEPGFPEYVQEYWGGDMVPRALHVHQQHQSPDQRRQQGGRSISLPPAC